MRRVLPLTLGSLALGLDAYVIAGILPAIGAGLHTGPSSTGQLVTAFTLSYGLLSPVAATLLTGRPVRVVLLAALAVFTLGNLLGAVAGSFALLLAARAVAGLGAGVYSPMSVAAAAALVEPGRRGRALATITGAMSVGAAGGVPLGLTVAYHAGWRATLWMVTGLGAVALLGVGLRLPKDIPAAAPSLRARLDVLRDRRVAAVALITMLTAATSIGLYTYVSPLLSATLHVHHLAGYLWIWGLGGLAGSLAIGRAVDAWRDTRGLSSVVVGALGVALALFAAVHTPVAALALLLVWGATGWGSLAPQQHRMLALRCAAGPVAVSLNASALYLGSALGAVAGGLLIGVGTSPPALAAVFGAVAIAAAALNLLGPGAGPAEVTHPIPERLGI